MDTSERGISFGREEETLVAKSLWFASLSCDERMEMLVQMTNFILTFNPDAANQKDAGSRTGRVLVLERT